MDLQTMLTDILSFINESVIPTLLGLAFLFFLWNIFRYFIFEGANEESHEKAKLHATWGIAAFVIMLSFWGIVNIFVDSLGIGGSDPTSPDYQSQRGGG